MLLGVFASFIGATFQALNYALTQNCQQRYNIDGVRLLVAVHICLAVFAIIPAFCYWKVIELGHFWAFLQVTLPYLLAQYCLIRAIRLSDASIVSPLLALKIPVLAIISIVLFQAQFSQIQWSAIVIILAIGWYFSSMSGAIAVVPLLLVLVASLGYSLSDMAITELSHTLIEGTALEQAIVTICLIYLVCGLFILPLMKPMKIDLLTIFRVKWVALTWFIAGILLVVGFNLSGVVSGYVVQSLRGVIGVILAFMFFRSQINQPMLIWRKKLVAAVAMFAAVALFYL